MNLLFMTKDYINMITNMTDSLAACKSNAAARDLIEQHDTLLQNYNLSITEVIKTLLSPKDPEAKEVILT